MYNVHPVTIDRKKLYAYGIWKNLFRFYAISISNPICFIHRTIATVEEKKSNNDAYSILLIKNLKVRMNMAASNPYERQNIIEYIFR